MLKKNEEKEILSWVQEAVNKDKTIDRNAMYLESDAEEIAAKHGLVLKRPPSKPKSKPAPARIEDDSPIVEHVETRRAPVAPQQKPKKLEHYDEGMIADAILGSESFRKAVVSVLMSNKKLIADLINESLKSLHIEVRTRD